MARLFDDASSQYLYVSSVPVTGMPLTLACWFYSDDTSVLASLVCLSTVGAAGNQYYITMSGTTPAQKVGATIQASGAPATSFSIDSYSANTWTHACGVFTSSTSRLAYINGSAGTENTNSVSPSSPTGTQIGARLQLSADRYMSGRIAEVAIWNAALGSDRVSALAKGLSPLLVRPENLVMYVPLIVGNDRDIRGGLSFTQSGSPTIANHVRVFYPSVPFIRTPAGTPIVTGSAALTGAGTLASSGLKYSWPLTEQWTGDDLDPWSSDRWKTDKSA